MFTDRGARWRSRETLDYRGSASRNSGVFLWVTGRLPRHGQRRGWSRCNKWHGGLVLFTQEGSGGIPAHQGYQWWAPGLETCSPDGESKGSACLASFLYKLETWALLQSSIMHLLSQLVGHQMGLTHPWQEWTQTKAGRLGVGNPGSRL